MGRQVEPAAVASGAGTSSDGSGRYAIPSINRRPVTPCPTDLALGAGRTPSMGSGMAAALTMLFCLSAERKETVAKVPLGLLALPVGAEVIGTACTLNIGTTMPGAATAREVPPVGGDPAAFAIVRDEELGRGPIDLGWDAS